MKKNPISLLIAAIVFLTWAILGFLVWVPMLIRTTIVVSSMMFYAAITGSTRRLEELIETAVAFYARGFITINRALFSKGDQKLPDQEESASVWVFVLELLWTVIFWVITVVSTLAYLSRDLGAFSIESNIEPYRFWENAASVFNDVLSLAGSLGGVFFVGTVMILAFFGGAVIAAFIFRLD